MPQKTLRNRPMRRPRSGVVGLLLYVSRSAKTNGTEPETTSGADLAPVLGLGDDSETGPGRLDGRKRARSKPFEEV